MLINMSNRNNISIAEYLFFINNLWANIERIFHYFSIYLVNTTFRLGEYCSIINYISKFEKKRGYYNYSDGNCRMIECNRCNLKR